MKKITLLLLIICFLLASCQSKKTEDKTINDYGTVVNQEEFRGIWISCYDHISAEGKTREKYKTETDEMFRKINECHFNTAFVHLRAFSDAFYKSDIYPYSSYIAGKEGSDLPFDPFEVILESAEEHGITIHGWINPFRVSNQNDTSKLSDKNPAKSIIDSGNKNGQICILENGIYYNPSFAENHKIIIDGLREIISKYDIDGIHIDDYFYPSTDKTVDAVQYSEYKSQGGLLTLSEWRETNVNAFVSALYSALKSENNKLIFSISPSAKLSDNKEKLYADCELWLANKGYADMIIPQIYFGFNHESADFNSLLSQWGNFERNPSVKLICGIGAYKCRFEDEYAGKGRNEWCENQDILARQVSCIRENKNYGGFALFSYQDLIRENCKSEIQKFKETVRDNEKR